MKRDDGFSLVELLVVVVIIGILAALAVPNLLASRRAANEASALATLKTIHTANYQYYNVNDSFTDVDTLLAENYLGKDSAGRVINLGCPLPNNTRLIGYLKDGYVFGNAPVGSVIKAGRISSYAYYTLAVPYSTYFTTATITGVRSFYIDTFSNQLYALKAGSINPCSLSTVLCVDLTPPPKPATARCNPIN
jgi:prepilin-type N-terminal cleavage/methylation domain-containing protein